MNNSKFDFVESVLITSMMGVTVPVACLEATSFTFSAGETAAMVLLSHAFTVFLTGVAASLDKTKLGNISTHGALAVMSTLVGLSMYKCLVVAAPATVTLDYTCVASGTLVGMTTVLSVLSSITIAQTLKSLEK